MVTVSPYGYEICPDCIRVALVGERCGARAQWPTWERYQEAVRLYPEFMMTADECERSEELRLYDGFFDLTIIES